jgi:hypothetical protein
MTVCNSSEFQTGNILNIVPALYHYTSLFDASSINSRIIGYMGYRIDP